MGQQQLLLLTLCIVLVGIAVSVGIDAFLKNRRQAEADIVVNNLVRLASLAQEWKLRPGAVGGGQEANGFEGVGTGFARLGWPTTLWRITTIDPDTGRNSSENASCYRPNENSLYCPIPQLSGRRGGGTLYIYALSNVVQGTGNTIDSNDMNLIATAVVRGTGPNDISVAVDYEQ